MRLSSLRSALCPGSLGLGTFVSLLLALMFLQSAAAAQVKEVRRVLVLSEVGPYYPAIALVDQGIHYALGKSPYQVELYREYLDTGLFPDPAAQREFLEWYIRIFLRPSALASPERTFLPLHGLPAGARP